MTKKNQRITCAQTDSWLDSTFNLEVSLSIWLSLIMAFVEILWLQSDCLSDVQSANDRLCPYLAQPPFYGVGNSCGHVRPGYSIDDRLRKRMPPCFAHSTNPKGKSFRHTERDVVVLFLSLVVLTFCGLCVW